MFQYEYISSLINDGETIRYIMIKFFVKSIIFWSCSLLTLQHINTEKWDIDYPFSAYSSMTFYFIHTHPFIEIPLMILGINSFLVWSVNVGRSAIINFLDITGIIWVIMSIMICLNNNNQNNKIKTTKIESLLIQFYYNILKILKREYNNDEQYEIYTEEDSSWWSKTNKIKVLTKETKILGLINIGFILWIVIATSDNIFTYIDKYYNDNLYAIVTSIILSTVVMIIPKYYNKNIFLFSVTIYIIAFLFKILYIWGHLDIDIATGIFHILISISSQICVFLINNKIFDKVVR